MKEREFFFNEDVDFLPTLEYKKEGGEKTLKDLEMVIKSAEKVILT